jgi:K+ transporter
LKNKIFLGGIFALCALLTGKTSKLSRKAKNLVNIISILSAAFLIGKTNLINK